jgi:hypothetical protein
MATIIDELVVLLRLDGGKEFEKGQKDIDEGLKKTKQGATATGKELEFRAKRSVESFSKFRDEVIALFAAFTAGVGLKNFVADTVRSEANLGRMSHALDVSTETLSQWQGVLKRNGGTAEDATSAFRTLADIIAEVQTTGTTGKGGVLMRMGISGGINQLQDKVGSLLEMADKASHMDPQTASFMLRQIGFSEAMVNVMLKGRGALEQLLEQQKKLGVTTDADVRAAQRLQDSLEGLKTASSRVGAAILTALEPAMDFVAKLFTALAEFAQNNQPIVIGALTALSAAFVALGVSAAGAVIAASPILGPLIVVSGIALAAGAAIGVLYEALTRGAHAFMEFVRHNKTAHDALNEVIASARDLWAAITELLAPMKPVADAIGSAFKSVGDAIRDAFGSATVAIGRNFLNFVVNSFHAIADVIRAITALVHGDLKGAMAASRDFLRDSVAETPRASRDVPTSQAAPGAAAGGAPASQSKTGRANAAEIEARLRAGGLTAEQARGVVAGIHAESGFRLNAFNGAGGGKGAFGIGQWRGSRLAELRRRYGPNPTLAQQVDFLLWELMGGDRGGRKVLGQSTVTGAMQSYIRDFMRPDLPGSTAASEGDIRRGNAFLAANSNLPSPGVMTGARAAQSATAASAVSHTEVSVGDVTIVTQARDADGIARDFVPAVKRRFVQQVNQGLS